MRCDAMYLDFCWRGVVVTVMIYRIFLRKLYHGYAINEDRWSPIAWQSIPSIAWSQYSHLWSVAEPISPSGFSQSAVENTVKVAW